MTNLKTIDEAKKKRYNVWSGNPKGFQYNPSRCAAEVMDGYLFYQCSKKPGYGPGKLYCKQHARKIESKA